MRFKARRGDRLELNLTSLIDVVFVLLIFFVLTTTFERHAELQIELPNATAEPLTRRQQPLELAIDSAGRYYINGRALVNNRSATLSTALDDVSKGRADTPIILNADGRTPHQAVVTAMDVAARLGLTHLSIATTHDER
ncbi:MAG: biopolymer transporter ExbD [Gammaproteobacteria bacterium]|nr:biopolymer transporter ExbD [Gammaproteobacteria bacterium]